MANAEATADTDPIQEILNAIKQADDTQRPHLLRQLGAMLCDAEQNKRRVLYASRTYDRHQFSSFTFLAPRFHDRETWFSHSELAEGVRIRKALEAQWRVQQQLPSDYKRIELMPIKNKEAN